MEPSTLWLRFDHNRQYNTGSSEQINIESGIQVSIPIPCSRPRRQPVLSRTITRWSEAAEIPWFLRGIRGSRIEAVSAVYLASGVGRAQRRKAARR